MTKAKRGGGGVRLGLLAAAGAAAGYYFYASKDAKKHRKIAAQWAGKLKTEVVKQARRAQGLDKKKILKIVNDAAAQAAGSVQNKDVGRAAAELKRNWQKIVKELNASPSVRKAKKRVAKAVSSLSARTKRK